MIPNTIKISIGQWDKIYDSLKKDNILERFDLKSIDDHLGILYDRDGKYMITNHQNYLLAKIKYGI